MTATEELRRLLDERGVEYTEDHGYREFFWEFGESGIARASAIGTKGLVQMIVTGITPEQAIEATLGRTCEVVSCYYDELLEGWQTHLSCGHYVYENEDDINYCIECGAKVER